MGDELIAFGSVLFASDGVAGVGSFEGFGGHDDGVEVTQVVVCFALAAGVEEFDFVRIVIVFESLDCSGWDEFGHGFLQFDREGRVIDFFVAINVGN